MIIPAKCLHHPHRIVIVLLAIVGVLAMANGVIGWSGGSPPVSVGTSPQTVIPTTGSQGFLVAPFCDDTHTTVTLGISPPDSTFAAYYTLDRRLNGVHEVVEVGVYADTGRMPVASHYDSANNRTDAFVDRDALGCIVRKGK